MYWSFSADDCSDADGIRTAFMSYLRARAVEEADFMSAEIAFGELVGNVVRHAPGPIAIEVDWSDRLPILSVCDRGPGFEPKIVPADLCEESGRGLFLVRALAGEPNLERRSGGGSRVSVTLLIPRTDAATLAATA